MALDTAGLSKPSSPNGDVLRDACIVTPTYNERGNVPRLVEAISESCGSTQFRMLVMDDASPDGTADAVDEMSSRFPNVRAVRRKGERGYGKAVAEGILTALDMGVKYVVTMDADFSHSPEAIPELLKEALQNDLVIGSRYLGETPSVAEWPKHRLVMSQVANAYVRLMTRVKVEDATSGFRCWSADFARKLPLRNLQAGGFAFLYETLFYAGELKANVREIPNFYRGRTYGESKMGTAIVLEALWVPLRLRSSSMMRSLSGGQ